MLKKFFDTFVRESLTLTKELGEIQSENEIIFLKYIERYTMRISCGKTTQLNLFLNYLL